MAITVTKGLIGKEDVSFNPAGVTPETFDRTAAGGGTQTITKLAPAHLNIEDAGNLLVAANVEDALQEVAINIANIQEVASQGQGPDIASSSVLVLDDNSLYFRVTGTTQINSILQTAVSDGRLLVLQFVDSLLVEQSNLMRLKEGRFTSQAGDFMMLMNDGNVWYELTRWRDHGEKLHDGVTLFEIQTNSGPMKSTGRDTWIASGWAERVGASGTMFTTDGFGERF